MKPGRLDGFDCAITWPSDGDRMVSARRRSDAHDASTWRKICPAISSLKMYFRHVFDLTIAWTRVHAIDALRFDLRRSDLI